MNKIILCIALLLCQLQAIGQSQSRYDCLYEYTVKASMVTERFILQSSKLEALRHCSLTTLHFSWIPYDRRSLLMNKSKWVKHV